MIDPWVFFICGMLAVFPLAAWFGIQVGRLRERDEWEKHMDSLAQQVAVPGE